MRKMLGVFQAHRRFFFAYTFRLMFAAFSAGRRLQCVQGKARNKKTGAVVAVVPYYGDHRLMPWFLGYYRRLGVPSFVFLDLSQDGDLDKHLADEADCTIWRPRGGFIHPSRTLHALNFLRQRYARNKWCLSVEPYEMLVFPHSETRHIRDLIDFIECEHRSHVFAIVVETYGEVPASEIAFSAGQSPLDHIPFFDSAGYATGEQSLLKSVPIKGGLQRRALFAEAPQDAPHLHRVPLVRLAWDRFYLASTRLMVPFSLNTAHAPWHSSPTACLLHFAILTDDFSLHIAKQAEAGRLCTEDARTLYPGAEAMIRMALKIEGSRKFTGSTDLLESGLLNNGQWF
jgi:hypothetical protein